MRLPNATSAAWIFSEPGDSNTGTVSVVVTNNSRVSAPFSAQLASYAPAFFLYSGTSYAIASHYPDYGLIGNPSAVSGTIAAKPGDVQIAIQLPAAVPTGIVAVQASVGRITSPGGASIFVAAQ